MPERAWVGLAMKIFLSHSSKDKELVRRLANDLKQAGLEVWLDEWEIKVGDSITHKIDRGLSDCDYVVVVLSEAAIRSGWVEREWRSAIFAEIDDKRVRVLPILAEPCTELPALLRDKKYADFSSSYEDGFDQLKVRLLPDAVPALTDAMPALTDATPAEPYQISSWNIGGEWEVYFPDVQGLTAVQLLTRALTEGPGSTRSARRLEAPAARGWLTSGYVVDDYATAHEQLALRELTLRGIKAHESRIIETRPKAALVTRTGGHVEALDDNDTPIQFNLDFTEADVFRLESKYESEVVRRL